MRVQCILVMNGKRDGAVEREDVGSIYNDDDDDKRDKVGLYSFK